MPLFVEIHTRHFLINLKFIFPFSFLSLLCKLSIYMPYSVQIPRPPTLCPFQSELDTKSQASLSPRPPDPCAQLRCRDGMGTNPLPRHQRTKRSSTLSKRSNVSEW